MTCDGCQGRTASRVARKRGLAILRCHTCGLYFVHPQPSAASIRAFYAGNALYAATRQASLGETSDSHARDIDSTVLRISGRRGSFLDIGCSTGSLIYHLRRRGWSVEGIDLNEASVKIARKHGLDVRAGALEEMAADKTYDVVHMGDVVEHVPSPRRAFCKARDLVAPGGVLVVDVPNAASNLAQITLAASRLIGVQWVHSEAPLHLYEFSAGSLSRMLEAGGFQPVDITCRGRMPFAYAVGASGHFDVAKKALKRSGRYRFGPELVPSIPMLALVSLGIAPCWLASVMMDRLNGRLYKMRVVAKRFEPQHPSAGPSFQRNSDTGL
jgi:2-polyprenyl-3-methyl-5-hydroxy-6-metoxy-1,4-benzoquinol methylase